jgi:purine-binding chemotaxis protein CheW
MTEDVLEKPTIDLPEAENLETDTQQFVIFLVGKEAFAVDMAPVQEIIRVPEIVRVPLAPASLEGLANLRGKVLPIVSLRRIFGFEERTNDEATRALVIDLVQPLGFVVDRVVSVINVELGHIEGVEDIRTTIDSQLLTGLLKDVGGFPMVMILDFSKVIAKEFSAIASLARSHDLSRVGAAPDRTEDDSDGQRDELQLVSFALSGQEYAIDIGRVQEIVQVPETIAHVPNQPTHVVGLMTLRERLLPLVSLRKLFGLPDKALDEKSRIVVVALGEVSVGLVADSVSEVLRVNQSIVDDLPSLLAREGELADITRICRLDDGKRLVSIIQADLLLRNSGLKEAIETMTSMSQTQHTDLIVEEGSDEEEQVVVFRLANGEFGVPIDTVQEIVRVPEELTHVPKAPSFVEGVINLRGAVLPVIDQRKRLELPAIERNDRQRIMVFLLSGVRTGFIVDAVTEVLKIPKAAIEPSPRLSNDQAKLLGRVANLEKQQRMIQLINPVHLMDETDCAQLADLEA